MNLDGPDQPDQTETDMMATLMLEFLVSSSNFVRALAACYNTCTITQSVYKQFVAKVGQLPRRITTETYSLTPEQYNNGLDLIKILGTLLDHKVGTQTVFDYIMAEDVRVLPMVESKVVLFKLLNIAARVNQMTPDNRAKTFAHLKKIVSQARSYLMTSNLPPMARSSPEDMMKAMTDPASMSKLVEQTMSNPQMSKQISEMIPKLMAGTAGMASITQNPHMKAMFDSIAKQVQNPAFAGSAGSAGQVGQVGLAGSAGQVGQVGQTADIFGAPDADDGTL